MSKKGRDKELIKLRDQMLIRRYYFWSEIKRRRYDDILDILSRREFFISPFCIQQIINRSQVEINTMIAKQPSEAEVSFINI